MSALTVADLGTIKHMRGKRTNPSMIANTFGFASVAALFDAVLDIAEPSAPAPKTSTKGTAPDRGTPPAAVLEAPSSPPVAAASGAPALTPPEPMRLRAALAPSAPLAPPPATARPVSPERDVEENMAALAATAVAKGTVTVTKCPPAKLGRTGRMVLARRGRAPAAETVKPPKRRDTARKTGTVAEASPSADAPAAAEASPALAATASPETRPPAPACPAPAATAQRPAPLRPRRAAATPPTRTERATAQDLAELAREAAEKKTVAVMQCPTAAAVLTEGAKISAEDTAALRSHIAARTGKAA